MSVKSKKKKMTVLNHRVFFCIQDHSVGVRRLSEARSWNVSSLDPQLNHIIETWAKNSNSFVEAAEVQCLIIYRESWQAQDIIRLRIFNVANRSYYREKYPCHGWGTRHVSAGTSLGKVSAARVRGRCARTHAPQCRNHRANRHCNKASFPLHMTCQDWLGSEASLKIGKIKDMDSVTIQSVTSTRLASGYQIIATLGLDLIWRDYWVLA